MNDTAGCRLTLALLILLAGCRPRPASTVAEAPAASQARPAADSYSMAQNRWPPDLQLPVASELSPVPEGALPVVISGGNLWAGEPLRHVMVLPPPGSRVQVGFGKHPAMSGGSHYVAPLASVVRPIVCGDEPSPQSAVIYVDRRIPSRLLFDAVFTLFRGMKRFAIAAVPEGGGRPGVLPFAGRKELTPLVGLGIGDEGIGVRSLGQSNWLGAGCVAESPGPTIPLRAGRYDVVAAVDCVSSQPGGAGALSLAMGENVYPQAYVTVLSALARAANGNWRDLSLNREENASFLSASPRAKGDAGALEVVAGFRPAFRACFDRELARQPGAGGTLELKLHVGADGRVTRVSHEGGQGLGSAVTCMIEAAGKGQFEPPAGGSAVITVPIGFESGDCWQFPY